MELSVLKPGSSEAGKVSVSDLAFAREYNEDLVHQVVTAFRAGDICCIFDFHNICRYD